MIEAGQMNADSYASRASTYLKLQRYKGMVGCTWSIRPVYHDVEDRFVPGSISINMLCVCCERIAPYLGLQD